MECMCTYYPLSTMRKQLLQTRCLNVYKIELPRKNDKKKSHLTIEHSTNEINKI